MLEPFLTRVPFEFCLTSEPLELCPTKGPESCLNVRGMLAPTLREERTDQTLDTTIVIRIVETKVLVNTTPPRSYIIRVSAPLDASFNWVVAEMAQESTNRISGQIQTTRHVLQTQNEY